MVSALFCIPAYAQGQTTVRDFLTWSEPQQANLMRSVVYTATVIATQVRADMASCIADWYSDNPNVIAARNSEIKTVMADYPDSHPTPILIAVIQRECGRFNPEL
ncbi:MAG: hypothetical protein ACE360_00585 [Hyphomicrobiales bacterium]